MLVILCAEIEEAKHINCPNAVIVVTGVGYNGILNASKLNFDSDDTIINIGYAGSNKYPIGAVVSVCRSKMLSKKGITKKESLKLIPEWNSDLCYTAEEFISEPSEKEIPLIDMELYYLALRYPHIKSIKIVSDNLNYSEYKKANLEESWKLVNNILNGIIEWKK